MTSFERGFAKGVAAYRSGRAASLISHDACALWKDDQHEFSRGMHAASQALDGWFSIAEREALFHGFDIAAARRIVDTARGI
jgi:hypothetical protein